MMSMLVASCYWIKPINLTDRDTDVMDKQIKRDVQVYNIAWNSEVFNRGDHWTFGFVIFGLKY